MLIVAVWRPGGAGRGAPDSAAGERAGALLGVQVHAVVITDHSAVQDGGRTIHSKLITSKRRRRRCGPEKRGEISPTWAGAVDLELATTRA